jgi:tetratricopeptide (TPR) repeat protein
LTNDQFANEVILTALIKRKLFDEAIKLLKSLDQETHQKLIFEYAYVLHRSGENKEALTKINQYQDKDSFKFKQLLS